MKCGGHKTNRQTNREGLCYIYHVDLAAVICFVRHPKALQAMGTYLSLTLVSDQFIVWYCDVNFFLICGTIYFM